MRIAPLLFSLLSIFTFGVSPARAADESPESMFVRLSTLVASGNPDIQYNLGMFYNNGIGTPRDNKAAFRHFLVAAEAGSELAAYKVGCYYAGQFDGVVSVNEEAALRFKLRAAEAGYDLAQWDVAMYLGRAGDVAKAMEWLDKASRQGNAPATAFLANRLSADTSPDKAKGLALMLVMKERMREPSQQLDERIAQVGCQLSATEKTEAERIRASWHTGATQLTAKARGGLSAVPDLLTSLGQ